MAVPPSLRRGDVEVLIAQQQLNVAVVEQLHAARLAFYAALYNRSLESIRDEQRRKLEENVATQKESLRSWVGRSERIHQRDCPSLTNWIRKLRARIAPIGKRN